jgi:hypothetical protein
MGRRVAAVAVVLALGGASEAAAQTNYGGGFVPSSIRQVDARHVGIGASVDGGQVLIRAHVSARCGFGEVLRRVPIAADGSFLLRATVRRRLMLDRSIRRTARIVVAGRLAGATGSGIARVRLSFRRRGRVINRCSSRTHRWQVRSVAPEGPAGAPRAGALYYGLTSQGGLRPLTLRVNRRGNRIVTTIFDMRTRCGEQTKPLSFTNITPGTGIRADGTFQRVERYTLVFSDARERYTVRLRGRFTPNGVSGTLRVSTVVRYRNGRRARCTTGGLTFAASL